MCYVDFRITGLAVSGLTDHPRTFAMSIHHIAELAIRNEDMTILYAPLVKAQSSIQYGHSRLVKCSFARSGFLVIGPNWLGIVATSCVLCAGTWMNLRLLHKFKNFEDSTKATMELVIYSFCIACNLLLLLAALNDPGIVFPPSSESDLDPDAAVSEWELKNMPYCSTCKVQTPPNRHIGHCYMCGYCIENLDHHCPWMGQCIGRRNKFWFIVFNICWILYFLEYASVAIMGDL